MWVVRFRARISRIIYFPLKLGYTRTRLVKRNGTGAVPKVAAHQSNCALFISLVSLLDESIPARVSNDTDKIVCEHKPDAAVRYPAEGSERAI